MRSLFMLLPLCIALTGRAQTGIKWKYSVKKLPENTYEVHMTAYVSPPWHIYSQHMEEGGPLPTSIHFDPDSLIEVIGPVRESGKPVTRHENVFNIDVTYYVDSVDFVQKVVKRKPAASGNGEGNLKTSLSGAINFMICKEDQCLAPTHIRFTLQLE